MRITRLTLFALALSLLATDPTGGQPVVQVRQGARPAAAPQPVEYVDQATADKKALEAAALKGDDANELLSYLRQRTLSDADLSQIQGVIRRLGADDFEERLKAAAEAERFGPAAVGPLRHAALSDPDPEVAYRAAESLRRLEKVPHAAVAAAAVRALARLRPAETAPVLLAFLPLADDQVVVDEIRTALTAVAVRDGKAEPALVAALTDPAPARRAAAAVALVEGGPAGARVRIKDAYPQVLAAARAEKDVETRFQMLYPLLTVAREKEAVGMLIDTLPDLPRGRLWQAEDFLIQLADRDAPKAVFGRSKESLAKAQAAWKGWWDQAAAGSGLESFAYTPRVEGKTLLVLMDARGFSSGTVMELGPDMKERWKITGLSAPMDAVVLPDGTVAIPEHNSNALTIRETTGRVRATRTIGGNNRVSGNPQQVQLLPNGNLLVSSRNVIVEFKKDKEEEVMRYVRNQYDMAAAVRLPTGETMVLLQNGPDHCLFLDEKGKELPDKKLKTAMPYYQAHATVAGEGRVLVTELNQVVEYDLAKGAKVWSKAVNQPRSVQRLPNGNTLIADAPTSRLVEVTPDGEEVWSYQPTNGMQVFRGYRR